MATTTAHLHLCTRLIDSPYGPLTIVGSAAGLRAILWHDDDLTRAGLGGMALRPGSAEAVDEAARQLGEYFDGARTIFDLTLDLRGTAFQIDAWQALAEIPYGETRTYAEQAARLGKPTAVRAVGAANGRNPLSIILPCHRVVGSDGALRGFAGGIAVKAALLEFERAHLDRCRRSPPAPQADACAISGAAALPPGRARWGGSGSLNPKSAPAGPNAVRGTVSSGLVCARGVDRSGPAHWERSNRVRSGRKQR